MQDFIMPEIEDYAERHSMPESEVCRELREETERTMELARMLVGPYEAAFLKMMVLLVRAKRVLEIGMFTGYSALSMAEVLPDDGELVTCELDPEPIAVARRHFAKSVHGRKIQLKPGPALDTLRDLRGPFDVVFIDADKQNYLNYYRRALDLVAPTGVILIDNVLWAGEVLKQPPSDERAAAIQELNRTVAEDPRVRAVLAPIRDGVLIVAPVRKTP